ncbi:MAG: exodeoxyribonuclease VII large subunit [Saprospiraceae bacterium]
MPASYSLYELNEYVKRVIALNFAEPIWVNCEIAQVNEVRGNVYLDLVYHDADSNEVTAQISASIWYKSYLFLKNKLGVLLPSLLKEGTHVLIKVQVEYHERYGMKLIIEDIDPSFTIGQMEMNRQKILQKLEDERLLNINNLLKLPVVIQRIAVISSATAAGYSDFKSHIEDNPYGYKYQCTLYPTAMQGQNTEREICNALEEIQKISEKFDCIIIIRGGGSKLDLGWFDNFNIGARISKCSLPVIVGIGHDIDFTVADIVAHTSVKTPTAVADFLIEHNVEFENKVLETTYWISQLSKNLVKQEELSLIQTTQMLRILPRELVRNHHKNITLCHQNILDQSKNIIKSHKQFLNAMDTQITLLDPSNVLRRGYAIIRQEGKIVSRAATFEKNKKAEVQFYDKTINLTSS